MSFFIRMNSTNPTLPPEVTETGLLGLAGHAGAIRKHFDLLHERALQCGGPSEYGQTLDLDHYPELETDPEAQKAIGWICGFSAGRAIHVLDLATMAALLSLTSDAAVEEPTVTRGPYIGGEVESTREE
jgi:hypothetical protein